MSGSAISLLVTVAVAATVLSAQPPVREVVGLPSCPRCQIVVSEPHSVVGGVEGLNQIPESITWDSRGRLYFTQARRGGVPFVYDPSTKNVTALGRAGSGPGEFRMATVVEVIRGDTLVVFDRGNQRFTFLTPHGRFARSAPAPMGTLGMRWWNDASAIAVNGAINDPDRVGLPIHLFDPIGNEVRSLGAPSPRVMPGDVGSPEMRSLGRDSDGNLLAVTALGRYQIEVYSPSGALVGQFSRRPRDFVYQAIGRIPQRTAEEIQPPDPWIAAMWTDSAGRVWTLALVADKNWRKGISVRPVNQRREVGWEVQFTDPGRYLDTIIEVLDLRSARLITRTRIDSACPAVSLTGGLACQGANADGTFRLDVRRLSLVSPP